MSGNHKEEEVQCSFAGFLTFVLGLIAGTFSALSCKIAYDTTSFGLDGQEKAFSKPIMMLLLMFAGMVPAIFFWMIQQLTLPAEKRDHISYQTMAILIVPSLCDLLCTLLLLVAQLYITASLWQMMRGSIIVITALLKRFVLNHRLKNYMWFGVFIITLAMLLVASTSFFGGNADQSSAGATKDPRIGIMLVVIGCIAQGVQYVFEEKVMSVDNAPPLVVIGCEGMWGTALTLLLVYPWAYLLPGQDNGHYEDPYDAYAMIMNSPRLKTLIVAFVLTVTVYNCAAVYVTKYLSSIWHAILDNFRPITIWGVGLLIYYGGTGYGEAWVSTSWLQLAGLIILLLGTAVYNGTFSSEVTPVATAADEEIPGQESKLAMSSPALFRSPLLLNRLQQQADQEKEAEKQTLLNSNNRQHSYQSTDRKGRSNSEV